MTADLFRLRPRDVHVWSLRLDLSQAVQDRLERVLSAGEASQAGRWTVAEVRRRSVAARGLLRVILAGYLAVRPEDVALEAGSGGKPELAGRDGPRFNLSHDGARGLLAVSADRDVGIDLEEVREVGDIGALAGVCFSSVERAALAAVPASGRRRAFFSGWTRKEAFLKVLGEGLSRPLDSFDVTLAPGEPARLLRLQGAPDAPGRYTLRALDPGAGWVAALAIDGPACSVTWRPWRMLSALLREPVASRPKADPGRRPLVGERTS